MKKPTLSERMMVVALRGVVPEDDQHVIADAMAENDRQRRALKAVEDWWLTEGMKHFNGAPYAIFAVREAIKGST